MRTPDKIRLRLRSLLRRDRLDRELDDEFLYHLDQLIAENIAADIAPGHARRLALQSIGSITHFHHGARHGREHHRL